MPDLQIPSGDTVRGPLAPPDPSPSADRESPARPDRRRARRIARSREMGWFALLAGPNIALILAFTYLPLASNLYYSMLNWRLGSNRATFVGLANYTEFFTSPGGLDVWKVTIVFTVITVVASMALGLLLATVLNRNLPGRGFTRAAVFSPYVLSGVGVGLVWNFIFDPQLGVIGHVLRALGRTSPEWFLNRLFVIQRGLVVLA